MHCSVYVDNVCLCNVCTVCMCLCCVCVCALIHVYVFLDVYNRFVCNYSLFIVCGDVEVQLTIGGLVSVWKCSQESFPHQRWR